MQRLYYFSGKGYISKPEFCIFPTDNIRNYRCYTLEDLDLFHKSPIAPTLREGEICILEAPVITLELIRQQLPEFFI